MLNLMLNFVSACRTSDLRVSTAEVIDTARHLELIDVLDEPQFRAALRANFAKSRREQRNFDRLYNLFFHDMRPNAELTPETADKAKIQAALDRMRQDAANDEISQAIFDFLAGAPIPYLKLMQKLETQKEEASKTLKSNLSQLSSRLEVMLRINQARNKILQFQGDNQAPGEPGKNQGMASHLMDRLETANRMLTEETRPYNDGLKQVNTYDKQYAGIGERPFFNLTAAEIEQM